MLVLVSVPFSLVGGILALYLRGINLSVSAAVLGAKSQVRPMFMLILVAMLGMMPAALATGIGSDIQRPLATVIVGGLLSTLPLTLLVLPSLYFVTAGRGRPASGTALLGEHLVIENEANLRAALPTLRPMVAEGVFVPLDAEVIPLGV